MRLAARKEPPKPLAERGRMMFIEDIQALYGKDPDGKWRKSRWWVLNKFAPEYKHKAGRDVYWWEYQVTQWLADQEAA